MKRFIASLVLAVLLMFYVIATIPECVSFAINLNVLPLLRRYGDLYSYSHLPQFRKDFPYCTYVAAKPERKKKVRLIIMGDSFTEQLKGNEFAVDRYQHIYWKDQLVTELDTTWTNILILESVERYLTRFTEPGDNIKIEKNQKQEGIKRQYTTLPTDEIFKRVFGISIIEQNIEFIMFNNRLCNKAKEVKASINYALFDRVTDTRVAVSKDGKTLYLREAVDSSSSTSPFHAISDSIITARVEGINRLCAKYKSLGFDSVFFSIIPDKVSIVPPGVGQNNHQIERIQNHPLLRAPFINIYDKLAPLAADAFYFNDAHWSCNGQAAWLNDINKNFLPGH